MSQLQQELIIAYWFSALIDSVFDFSNISKIILKFGEEFEVFEPSLTHEKLTVDDEGKEISNLTTTLRLSAIGANIAKPGYKYHWKVVILRDERDRYPFLNVDIVKAN